MFSNAFKFSFYIILVFFSQQLKAESIGVFISAGIWATQYSGYVEDNQLKSNSINLKDDLNLENSFQNFFYINIEQPINGLPNFRLGRTNIRADGVNTLNKSLTFQGKSFLVNEKINSKLNLDQVEGIVYWKLNNTIHRLDLGFAVKDFSGEVSVSSDVSGSSGVSLSATVPLIYLGYETELPLTAFTVGINSSFLKINEASLYDTLAYIRYLTESNIGLELGYRTFQLSVNSSTVKTDIKIIGFYLNGLVYF